MQNHDLLISVKRFADRNNTFSWYWLIGFEPDKSHTKSRNSINHKPPIILVTQIVFYPQNISY